MKVTKPKKRYCTKCGSSMELTIEKKYSSKTGKEYNGVLTYVCPKGSIGNECSYFIEEKYED